MEAPATYEDVNLILRLYELRREAKVGEARKWLVANFKPRSVEDVATLCPPGSEEDAYVRMVIGYWEMVASFITSGVLNRELFFQYGNELLFTWERIRGVVPQIREKYKNPYMMKNLEMVAEAFAQWMERRAPGSHAVFAAMVQGE